MTPLFAACSKITSQAFVYLCMRITLPRWRQLCAWALPDLSAFQYTMFHRLQSVICRFATVLSRSVHFSTSLASLFELVFGRLNEYSSAVPLLAQLLVLLSTSFHRHADVPSRRRPRSSSINALIVLPTTNSHCRWSCVSGFSCHSCVRTFRRCTLDNSLVYFDILLNDLQCKHKKLTAVLLFCGHTRLHRRTTKST